MKQFWDKYKWYIITFLALVGIGIILYFVFRKKTADSILKGKITTDNPTEFKGGQQLVAMVSAPYYEWSGRAGAGTSKGSITAGSVYTFQEAKDGWIAIQNPGNAYSSTYVFLDASAGLFKGEKL